MGKDVPDGANRTISAEVELRGRSREVPLLKRCSICFTPTWTEPFPLREPVEFLYPQQSLLLCKTCHAAVMRELQHVPPHTPVQVHIAVGLVAAERWPHLRPSAAEREERIWIGFLLCGFAGCVLVHLGMLILLARL